MLRGKGLKSPNPTKITEDQLMTIYSELTYTQKPIASLFIEKRTVNKEFTHFNRIL